MDKKSGIVTPGGAPIESGIVTPAGVSFKDIKEMKPVALGEFVICEIVEQKLETGGGIVLSSPDGTSGSFKFIVDSVGPAVTKLGGIKPGDSVMIIAPEMIQFPWSTKMWGFFHEDQIKAVIVDA